MQPPVWLDSPGETPSLPCAAGRFVCVGGKGVGDAALPLMARPRDANDPEAVIQKLILWDFFATAH